MSQAKVEQRKKEKKNRVKIMRREKVSRGLTAFLGVVIVAAIGVWIGFSVYQRQKAAALENIEYTDINLSALSDYEYALSE